MVAPSLSQLYLLRLACLSLASFFFAHSLIGALTHLAAPAARRVAERFRPRVAARFLLAIRLLPAGLALFVLAGLCVPSYLWLEPATKPEMIGFACWAAALLCVALWGISLVRVFRVTCGSLLYYRRCHRVGREARVGGSAFPVLVVDGDAPLMALAGLVRSRIVISTAVLAALSPEQLDAALEHERAHRASHDNLKRLLLLLAPDILPFYKGFAGLDRAWARYSEWAADDRAVAGDSRRSLALAAALVRVARMGAAPRQADLVSCLVMDGRDLSARVNRLLRGDSFRERPVWKLRALAGAVAVATIGVLKLAVFQPATLYAVHRLLEHLIH